MASGTPEFLSFQCPQCQKRLKAPPALAGKKLSCPKCSAAIRVPNLTAPTSNEDEWLSLDNPKPNQTTEPAPPKAKATEPTKPASSPKPVAAPKPTSNATTPQPTSNPSTLANRSVFDDDLPDLVPLESNRSALDPMLKDQLAHLGVPDITEQPSTGNTTKNDTSSKSTSTNAKHKPTAGKREPLVGSLEELSLDEQAFKQQFEVPKEEEFRFPCKVCNTFLYAKESRVGSKIRCPDCFSEFSIPSPPKKKQTAAPKLDENVAAVNLAPIDAKTIHDNPIHKNKTKEILDRAEVEVDRESQEIDDVTVAFDSKRWLALIFGYLQDPMVCVAAGVLGIITALWLVAIESMGTLVAMDSTQALIARIAIFLVGVFPIFGSICLCGLVIVTMAANRAPKVDEWPFEKWGESIGECLMFFVALIVGAIPGAMLGTVASALSAQAEVSFALLMLSVWAFTPLLLLSMIDNGSVMEPFSKPVYKSVSSHPEPWGAMYMQTGLAMMVLFCFLVLSLLKGLIGDVLFGLILPVACFFIFNQYGVLAGRISGVTEMGFTGDFSDD